MADQHPGDALSAYLDDELDDAARAALESHLSSCGECSTILDELRTLRSHATEWATRDLAPSPALWAGVAARIEPRPGHTGARVLPWYRKRWSVGLVELAAAASLIAAVTAGLMWRQAPGAPPVAAGPVPVVAQNRAGRHPGRRPDDGQLR